MVPLIFPFYLSEHANRTNRRLHFLGTSLAVFPQLFALAKGHLDRVGAETAERGTAMMRATWSIAWAVGPALGALLISLFDFQGVFLTAAMCVVTATVIVAVARVDALRTTTETGLEAG